MLQLFSRIGSRNGSDELKPGDRYCRTLKNQFLEIATVLELRADLVGIPHVRFTVAFEHPQAIRLDTASKAATMSSMSRVSSVSTTLGCLS
jgi:hypothetical protein